MQRGKLLDKLFVRGGRDGIILIFSLLLAFFMWGVQKLSQNYSTYINYKVRLTSSLEGRAQHAFSNDLLVVRGKASGFYIVKQLYGSQEDVLDITVEPKQLKRVYNVPDKFFLRSADIQAKLQEVLGEDLLLESFTTDTLYFNFPRQTYKKVPVSARHKMKCQTQYMPFSPIVLKPDSILIYGQTSVLKTIDSVCTNVITGENLNAPVNGFIAIETLEGIKFSTKEVYYSQEIGRYVENAVNIKVSVLNAPERKNIAVIPQEVRVKYRMPFTGGKEGVLASDFVVVADYDKMEDDGKTIRPFLSKIPKGVYAIQVEPRFVECIIN